jgi:DNA-binding GntR family transcriptional regulator
LAADGWVTLERNRGAFVVPTTGDAVREQAELAALIVAYVVERAVRHRSDDDARILSETAEMLMATVDVDKAFTLLEQFNARLLTMARAHRARTVWRSVVASPGNLVDLLATGMPTIQSACRDVAAAITRRDREAAIAHYRRITETMATLTLHRLIGSSDVPGEVDQSAEQMGVAAWT